MTSLTTIRTTVWDAIYTYLQTTNPISTNNIYSAMNSQLISSIGYPLVIIHPPSIAVGKLTISNLIKEAEVVLNIEIFHTSSATLKALVDNVVAKIMAGRTTFAASRLMNMGISGQDYEFWQEATQTIHFARFDVTFRYLEAS